MNQEGNNANAKQHNRKAQNLSAYSAYMLFAIIAVVLAKVIGFVREIMITHRFGYGNVTDGYYLGFAVPDLVYNILVGGAIGAAVVPMLSGAIERDEEDKVWPSISTFFTFIMIAFAGFMLVGELFSAEIISFLNPGQHMEVLGIATSVSRVVYLQTFFFILLAIITSTLSANKVYGLPALGDSVYNIFYLLAIVFFASPTKEGAVNVAWGVVFAAVMYFLYIFYFAKPYMVKYKPNLDFKDKKFWYLLWLAVPALLSGTVAQMNTIVQQGFAGLAQQNIPNASTGVVTSLRNANTLFNLPYQIIVSSIGGFLLSNISGFMARGADKEASNFLTKTVKLVLVIMVPVALFFAVFSEETVQAVYQWNPATYTNENVKVTAAILKIYSIDFIVGPFLYFINQVFFALQKNYIILITTIINLLANYAFCYVFINGFSLGIDGLAWATVLSQLIVTIISYFILSMMKNKIEVENINSFVWKSIVASIFTFSVLVLLHIISPVYTSKSKQLILYVINGVIAMGAYFLAAHFLEVSEVTWVFKMMKSLFKKVRNKIRPGK